VATTERQRTGLSGGVKPRSYQVTLALLETGGERHNPRTVRPQRVDRKPVGQPTTGSEPNRRIRLRRSDSDYDTEGNRPFPP